MRRQNRDPDNEFSKTGILTAFVRVGLFFCIFYLIKMCAMTTHFAASRSSNTNTDSSTKTLSYPQVQTLKTQDLSKADIKAINNIFTCAFFGEWRSIRGQTRYKITLDKVGTFKYELEKGAAIGRGDAAYEGKGRWKWLDRQLVWIYQDNTIENNPLISPIYKQNTQNKQVSSDSLTDFVLIEKDGSRTHFHRLSGQQGCKT